MKLNFLDRISKRTQVQISFFFYIFPTRCNITQFICFWKTALHVSGGIFTHHQEHTQLYLQYLVLVKSVTVTCLYCGRVGTGLSVVWELYWSVLVRLLTADSWHQK